jgi:hypothetical protein
MPLFQHTDFFIIFVSDRLNFTTFKDWLPKINSPKYGWMI